MIPAPIVRSSSQNESKYIYIMLTRLLELVAHALCIMHHCIDSTFGDHMILLSIAKIVIIISYC